MKTIVSRENSHFKALKKLCQSSRERQKAGRIVLDGVHLVQSYAERYGALEEIVVSESGCLKAEITACLEGGTVCTWLPDALFRELSSVETPTGILALAARPAPASGPEMSGDAIVLDGVQDPGNVGSILRSAAAAGFRQVLLSADCAQAWSPRVLRAAMGAHFRLSLHEDVNLPDFLAAYRGLALLTTLDAAASLYASELAGPLAWVFGNEGQGVRQAVAQAVPTRLRIPMPGGGESLNVAAAAAICLFETVRQRESFRPSPAGGSGPRAK